MSRHMPDGPRSRPVDLLTVQGQSMVVCTDAAGSRSFGTFTTMAPDVLDAWDALLDSKDAAHDKGPSRWDLEREAAREPVAA